MAAKKKTEFEKAAQQFGNYVKKTQSLTLVPQGYRFYFKDEGDRITCKNTYTTDSELAVTDKTASGDICKFIAQTLELLRPGVPAPPKLEGTGTGGFEELLMQEARRLERGGHLTMGRYPVASVMIKGSSRPLQVPSLTDFEGVLPSGHQFLIEAKVWSRESFEVVKKNLKPKQVNHMLLRHRFKVPGWLLIHFNERCLRTSYSPAITIALPVKPEAAGGLPIWEKLVEPKNKGGYVGSITRKEAEKIGVVIPWHFPPRCKTMRPNLARLVLPQSKELHEQ